ncbi:hypothetical protein [Streptomyces sp. NPDC008001]
MRALTAYETEVRPEIVGPDRGVVGSPVGETSQEVHIYQHVPSDGKS